MRPFSASIATRVSRILAPTVISLLAACSNTGSSLAGPTACDGITCGAGQLCVEGHAFPDDGGIPAHCADVAADCPVFDCNYDSGPACSSCVFMLCESCLAGQDCAIVQGRTLTCV
jgi:hypothetical protein